MLAYELEHISSEKKNNCAFIIKGFCCSSHG
ncbi:hypothetical protein CLIBASIA_05375 [Candidatus Liberibacter asiaticus str. psy62]|uniref:Uncharacterized protein n=1 Tax=Liberibacter asiaticus (strain psy62) TaxID=537021 RepID=C6XGY8_LIBAP|nr:hypothetical protein CLIBASIA_05375 [Candidatus Liberibacter asiaticus str. psy62]